ncbi:hypothetical protein BJD73_gp71 [Mycobacterium phage Brocalys]|uniref:Uncharacterized protein n=6 Tax=Cheoctovirus TaxID=1623281 RepID=A0A482JFG2_9CAUD|nr:hypothetical protein PBI_SAAL_78 [Mycobacterium phage Saal]YP_009189800.1 hypothetical protein AU088_gp078 [Mycobacterium phage Cabrinians]YP_009303910.1 hypothetical protein BJD73_gp71 [Mycobacterium phage Brocalys]YP_009954869.1 hypothetical protein I5H16_gp081 [Mycobacterium phage BobaPhett]YP_009957798.1 hypothetical protein I5H44_gp080 [Mycobacterium phage Gorge]YP_009959243.1 hypothetical protein I5H58_gp083 [Mycobacterium phage Lizziana]YP_009961694.1 hypothetical protein I5H82_gp07
MNNPELRAVLTEALGRHEFVPASFIADPKPANCACGEWRDSGPGQARVRHNFLEHFADAVLSLPGVAVIQLPEPDEHEDEEQEFTDFPGVGLYVPVVFDRHPGEVQIRAGAWCDEPLSVDEARGLAASILAAASYAEEAEE